MSNVTRVKRSVKKALSLIFLSGDFDLTPHSYGILQTNTKKALSSVERSMICRLVSVSNLTLSSSLTHNFGLGISSFLAEDLE